MNGIVVGKRCGCVGGDGCLVLVADCGRSYVYIYSYIAMIVLNLLQYIMNAFILYLVRCCDVTD